MNKAGLLDRRKRHAKTIQAEREEQQKKEAHLRSWHKTDEDKLDFAETADELV